MNDRNKEKTTALINSLDLRLEKLRELDTERADKMEPEVKRARKLLKEHGAKGDADLAFSNVSGMLDQQLMVAEMAKGK